MTLMKWEPFSGPSVVNLFDRLFNRTFGPLAWPNSESEAFFSFPVNVAETEKELIFRAELPGLKTDEIEILATSDQLVIRGQRQQEKEDKDTNYLLVESSYGSFYRAFNVNVPVKAEEVKASYRNGLLEVRLPKAEGAKTRRVPIEG